MHATVYSVQVGITPSWVAVLANKEPRKEAKPEVVAGKYGTAVVRVQLAHEGVFFCSVKRIRRGRGRINATH